jgi:predicted GNAT family N-acyltransferase
MKTTPEINHKACFTFREITEAGELEAAFRLRYEVYAKCRLSPFLKPAYCGMDLDHYDLYSRHYGLFNEVDDLAGYFRVVLGWRESYQDHVSRFCNDMGINLETGFFGKVSSAFSLPEYPFLSYPELPAPVRSYFEELIRNNESLAEASRLIIKDEYRGMRTSAFLLECAVMLYLLLCIGRKHGVICCAEDHSRFYIRYGFKLVGSQGAYLCNCNHPSLIMTLPRASSLAASHIPASLHTHLENLANEFLINHKITRVL